MLNELISQNNNFLVPQRKERSEFPETLRKISQGSSQTRSSSKGR